MLQVDHVWPHTAASGAILDFVCEMSGTKRMSYTVAFKIKVVKFAEKSGNRRG